ncbi:glycoside hydrolase family 94 protein [Chitinolyticbacter meiyuanensis]|uniref:glycoside hydrolase family 94 protein n=1 Tax=Chitinolyticbacter meiyuanensis TaxID=682798 RepID=UPI001FEB5511|nr:glycoside hydrolase family 94 protein [Chitinolyticbacter meiyuanensis]
MTLGINYLPETRQMWLPYSSAGQSRQASDLPLRAELFSADQMAQHGRTLAASHTLSTTRVADQLLSRLADNESRLIEICRLLTQGDTDKRSISPAGTWLLDNFYLIETQMGMAKRHLPKGYSLELPRLAGEPDAGMPRVYDIALEAVSHGDGRVDAESLGRFIAAYQSISPLKLGELWAVPIMLRLALIENLRRVAMQIGQSWLDRTIAHNWAERMIRTAEDNPKNLILEVADMARSDLPMTSSFVSELSRKLQGRGPGLALPLTWVEQWLAEAGLTVEQLVQQENQQQAADQVSISNSIGSLRALGAIEWREFVETQSVVEQVLHDDPAGTYMQMDFATRDRYRHVIESLGKYSRLSEGEIARQAVALADTAKLETGDLADRRCHVGYYLVDAGMPTLERAATARLPLWQRLRQTAARWPLSLYLGGTALLTALLSWAVLALAHANQIGAVLPGWAQVLLALPVVVVASQLAVSLVNWLATLLAAPQLLPRLDFEHGIPPEARTLVVVPTMLSSAAAVESLLEALEVRFLANRDEQLFFGLLTDFCDAPEETQPTDDALLAQAQAGVAALNRKYGCDGGLSQPDRFFLFHRPRRWNPQERVWMGFERKRGKLAELNALLRNGRRDPEGTGFSLVEGQTAPLAGVKYVITLDTDTLLPRDAARQMVGAMSHPLNRPVYDAARQRVVGGYGILQPRVATTLSNAQRSHYAALYGGDAGIDPYTRAVSDVYQDVFSEGSFIGKGIYDVDAFEQALSERFPPNHVLSHDLLEGCYARSGLLSDVQVYEDHPTRYDNDVVRRYRWIRGDWQLTGWLLSRVPGQRTADGTRSNRNPLSVLSQWKLFDNLRRSLVPIALLPLWIAGWLLLAAPWQWTLLLVGLLLLPVVCGALFELVRKPPQLLWRQHASMRAHALGRSLTQLLFQLAALPYEAWYTLDAIARTAWRMLVIRRHLLEWNPSSEVERAASRRGPPRVATFVARMWVSPLVAIACAAALWPLGWPSLLAAAPVLALWLVSPVLAWWFSLPIEHKEATLSQAQAQFLRGMARRTWAFFDHLVGPTDHWLPPDNYQQYRVVMVAHRTSPTNIGLGLLANLTAYDFGYISAGQLAFRTANTLHTLQQMEQYRGHWYNWYDTRTLEPLYPRYVSTVDSGNLAGHLMTLQTGLLEVADRHILSDQLFSGLADTLAVLAESSNGLAANALRRFRNMLAAITAAPPANLANVCLRLVELAGAASELVAQIPDTSQEKDSPTRDAHDWAAALARQCHDALDDLMQLAPWLSLPPAPAGVEAFNAVNGIPTLRELAELDARALPRIRAQLDAARHEIQRDWLAILQQQVIDGSNTARQRIAELEALAATSASMAEAMEHDFLYDARRHLFVIGYNVSEHRADAGYYDLLASEARLGCFVTIAQGRVPQESWFALGRLLVNTSGEPALLSWSGSMFEYLMPMLVMPSYAHTLLDQTCRAAVARQVEYGKLRGVPWGISESGYNTVDQHLNYQYHAFGVPGLGLKRGLAEDLVIAPYASVMALMVSPDAACHNLQKMAASGFVGHFGFFEAIDYTPVRQRRGQNSAIVHAFMAHHQGMSLLSLAYALLGQPMQRRFEANRQFQANILLLQERIPKTMPLFLETAQRIDDSNTPATNETPIRTFDRADTQSPAVQLLSNGRYHVMMSNAGGGYSRWQQLSVTRWREDTTRDNWGTFVYLRDVKSGTFWSNTHQPTLTRPLNYDVVFSEGRAEFRRRDAVGDDEAQVETHTDVVISPEEDIELRRVRITNLSNERREIDLTSYAEVVIAPAAADAAHPAFSNLFVQTEIVRPRHAILATRRPRSLGEQAPWMLHLMSVHGETSGVASFETDRLRFIGRARSTIAPQAVLQDALADSEGSVLDPIVAIRRRVVLQPDEAVTVDIVTGMAATREQAHELIEKYQDRRLADRVFDLAWTHAQVALMQINANEADVQLYARLASAVLYQHGALRADPAILLANRRGQSSLWGYAISGDLPIVLLQVGDSASLDLVRQLVKAHAYWRLKGLAVDLVIWNDGYTGYRQSLQEQIVGLIASGTEAASLDKPGGIFVRPAEQISAEDRVLLQAVARAIISDKRGSLAEQLEQITQNLPKIPRLVPAATPRLPALTQTPPRRTDLIHDNGLGGFTRDGREYVIQLGPDDVTPAPWVNVLANPAFGTIVSESGSAYTWGDNAHEYRLTPWHNDSVSDTPGEAIYLRDEDTGLVWTPTPLPMRLPVHYLVRHGFGYSVFETRVDGIVSELWVYVATDAAVKFSVLKLRNESGRTRRLSATGYVEWVLGELRAKSAMHISTELTRSGALFARNPYNTEFAEQVAFFDVDGTSRSVTGDRAEFLGRNGAPQQPAALGRQHLSGRVGAGLDPCAALQVDIELPSNGSREVVFRLGLGRNSEEAEQLVQRWRGATTAHTALEAVWTHWNDTLGVIQVETPDAAVNVLANGWLVYQTLACRVWARSGFYQSGGAFGFRDQLQDVMALVHAQPALVREHLLLCASRQFREGDVQHWWHPPAGRGVRTHCSDDYLWLPLVTARYVEVTGDTGVLDEEIGLLEGRPVPHDAESYYDLPGQANETATLYEHCLRAIRHGLRLGEHGLPLMGSGDWNDGMDLVGRDGKGESIWLAFFLYEVLRRFAAVAGRRGDEAVAGFCSEQGAQLRSNIEIHGWDGEWYRRAYFDDGTPLGSSSNTECQIDSISQSWSVLSGAGEPSRSRQAMQAVDERLVRREHGLINLFTPPFDRTRLNPGYIRGYVPGVRENGGQYTHGAIWTVMAFAALGDAERAWELLALINPVNHANTPEAMARYRVEPYVVAADVYALPHDTGRGGWSWYTGSAGWMYRLVVESLLGLARDRDTLSLTPRLPASWNGFTLRYRYHQTQYLLAVTRDAAASDTELVIDGERQSGVAIPLVNDGGEHRVDIRLPAG